MKKNEVLVEKNKNVFKFNSLEREHIIKVLSSVDDDLIDDLRVAFERLRE